MAKRTISKVTIAPGKPVRVEDFRYVDQGLEWNMQNEYDLRDDHLQASRVVNWQIFGEAALGLSGWTPGDSLKLYVTANELFVTEGLCYIGGRSYVLSANAELFDAETPANNTYNIYLKYTLASDEFAYEYTTSTRTDDHLIKYLLIGTAVYTGGTGWSSPVDKRASNTALGAPATVSGTDAGPIFTIENTGTGLGLLVKQSDAQIGEDGTPQILTIWGTNTTGLTLKRSGTANTITLSCDASGRMKVAGSINVTATGSVIASSATVGGVTLNVGAVSGVTTLATTGNITCGGTTTINTINAGVSDYNKFLVSDGGLIKFRTGAETYSDIGGYVTADFTTDFAAESLANLNTRTHSCLSDAPSSAHHVRYADSEVEAVITAELANGQSIDDAIDSLILTHKNIPSAHHAKWTTGDTETVINTELGDGQSIDNAIDSLILTHAGLPNAHHAQSHTLASHSSKAHSELTGVTASQHHTKYTNTEALAAVDEHIALESANATWINCPLEMWRPTDAFNMDSLGRVLNTGTTNGQVFYGVPLPTTRGGKKLHIKGTRVSLSDADVNNYITNTYIRGFTSASYTDVDTDPTDKKTIERHEDTSMNVDCSTYHIIKITLDTIVGNAGQLDIQFVTVWYYYA